MALEVSDMIKSMEAAMEKEWQAIKGVPMPAVGMDDRRLLFAAIARGILEYIKNHENEIFKSIKIQDSSGNIASYTITETNLNINKGT
jgi:hypothetical protein